MVPMILQLIPARVFPLRPCTQVMKDLLDMSARMLVLGGRLVYLLPCTSVFTPEELPVHPCLATVANCEEKLTLSLSRRVIVMEKVRNVRCATGPAVTVVCVPGTHPVHVFAPSARASHIV